jgi:cell division protein FtsI/penicillin-binding protein 2
MAGELIALGNYPIHDRNDYGKYSSNEMRSRAVRDVYESGSVFKIISASLAFEYGLVEDGTVLDCSRKR